MVFVRVEGDPRGEVDPEEQLLRLALRQEQDGLPQTARKGELAVACPQRRFVHSLQRHAILRLAAADDSLGGAVQSADGNATA